MEKYILAFDQGTTSSRCIVFDAKGNIVAKAQQEFKQIYPMPGWVEHNPQDILSSQISVAKKAVKNAGISADKIDSIGITNQRETVIVWNKNTGKPIYNAIVWQCRRSADLCNKLKEQGHEPLIYKKTGLVVDSYFSASKIKWILDNVPEARASAERGDLLCGTVDTWLLWHLTGGKVHATDYTNASRTMLFNIHDFKWDSDLLKLFDIPVCMLPEVHLSAYNYGAALKKFFGREIPIAGIAGDQQSALFGQLCLDEGSVKNTYGTGCFLLMHTGSKPVDSKRGLLTTIAAGYDKKENYALEGSVFIGGAVIQWLRDEMKIIKTAVESEKHALEVPDSAGIYVVPAFVGLGAPHWDSDARGTVVGLTRGTNIHHFVRACLESIAYQTFDVLHAMEQDIGKNIFRLAVDGGASANNFLMQFQSDIFNAVISRPKVLETTALGVAFLAGLTTGYFKNIKQIQATAHETVDFQPSFSEEKRQKLIMGWAEAVVKTRAK